MNWHWRFQFLCYNYFCFAPCPVLLPEFIIINAAYIMMNCYWGSFPWEKRILFTTLIHKNHALDDRMHALCMIVICPVKLRYATICDDFDPKISVAKTLSESCRHISRFEPFGTVSIPQSKILQSDWINQIADFNENAL